MDAWDAFYSDSDDLDYSLSDLDCKEAVIFSTEYDHNHPDNKTKKVAWEAEEHCLEWTKQQRLLAKDAVVVSDVADLKEEVCNISGHWIGLSVSG